MNRLRVSIDAPARGATELNRLGELVEEFQSTRPHGARHDYCINKLGLGVSIHAPARGATSLDIDAKAIKEVSIHAPARGATPGIITL